GGGGGSIAWIDDGGLLSVGPLSAGADPGPACYGIGGDRPTVTDANVVLGYLPPALAGGDLPLDVERARAVIARDLATPLGLSVEQAAHGVRQVVNATMARAIRAVTVERGVDPREFALAAFGGSGPVHACELAASLDITRILLPAMPGVFTAVGMLTGDVERHFLAALPGLLDDLSAEAALTVLADLRRRAAAALQDEGFGPERTEFRFALDLRFEGQDSELPIALAEEPAAFSTDDLRVRFLEDYGRKYGYASADAVEVVNLRLLARGIQPHKLDFRSLAGAAAGAEGNEAGERQIYFGPSEGWLPAPVVGRAALGDAAVGPLVVESPDSTIVLPPGARLRPDDFGNLLVDLEAAS
ncbi:MAG: hydantoinase/oxoprolinase family protein, partial [Alphaproteobacteria bacterium]|nr:hydantoinase/oxoprolinase family protein [Alphaproteobacteria bacterium]